MLQYDTSSISLDEKIQVLNLYSAEYGLQYDLSGNLAGIRPFNQNRTESDISV